MTFDELLYENANLRRLLKQLQWIGWESPWKVGVCDFCDRHKSEGHADDCELAEALRTTSQTD